MAGSVWRKAVVVLPRSKVGVVACVEPIVGVLGGKSVQGD